MIIINEVCANDLRSQVYHLKSKRSVSNLYIIMYTNFIVLLKSVNSMVQYILEGITYIYIYIYIYIKFLRVLVVLLVWGFEYKNCTSGEFFCFENCVRSREKFCLK